ncbi:hypothetical protein GF420_04750 [candidate division GN15 bacterium]|nr:hypothetical protein [candidate division GN15 bacterium]
MMKLFWSLSRLSVLFAACAVLAVGCGGDDDDDDNDNPRRIIEFHMNEVSASPRPPAKSIGADVRVPGLTGSKGLYFTGVMGTDSLNDTIVVQYRDAADTIVENQPIGISLVEGDGTLSADTLYTDSAGRVYPGYTFDGSLGYAVVRASVAGFAPLDFFLRANVVRYGVDGQGQHIRFTDTLQTVLDFNGTPEMIDPDPRNGVFLHYVVYETEQDVVAIMGDTNQNRIAETYEGVVGVILTADYDQTLPEGIGIGSTYDEMVQALGPPDSTGFDPTPPAADFYLYFDEGLTFFVEANSSAAANAPTGPAKATQAIPARGFRLAPNR